MSKDKLEFIGMAVLLVIVLAVSPIFLWVPNLLIGGDVMTPLNVESTYKFLTQWQPQSDGVYFSINYIPFLLTTQIGQIFSLNPYQYGNFLEAFLRIVGGAGIFLICYNIKSNKNIGAYVVPVAFYLYSPVLFNAWHYNFIYSFLPLALYFLNRIFVDLDFKFKYVLSLAIIMYFCSLELPNPKYLFYLFVLVFVILINQYRAIFEKISSILICGSLFLLATAAIWVPLLFFVFNYNPIDYGVEIKAGYKSIGLMMNYGTDTLDRIIKLHNDNIFLNREYAGLYNKFDIFNVCISLGIVIIIYRILKSDFNPRLKRYSSIYLQLFLIFFLLSLGPNFPVGILYEALVTKVTYLAFLRTTAGALFVVSIIFSVLLYIACDSFKSWKKYTITVVFLLSIVSYPILIGWYYSNFNGVNEYTDNSRGYVIPSEYFEIDKILNEGGANKDDRVLYASGSESYINTDWGFFGPFIYNFISQFSFTGYDKYLKDGMQPKYKYILKDKSIIGAIATKVPEFSTKIFSGDYIELYKIHESDWVPRFYIAKSFIQGNIYDLYKHQIQSVMKSHSVITSGEFKNINIDCNITNVDDFFVFGIYKVRSNCKSNFGLVFTDNFHRLWYLFNQDASIPQVILSFLKLNTLKQQEHLKVFGSINLWIVQNPESDAVSSNDRTVTLVFLPQLIYIFTVFISIVSMLILLLLSIRDSRC